MASVTNENVVPNAQEETTSPQKPAISPRDVQAINTPSTEAASPEALATLSREAEEATSPEASETPSREVEESTSPDAPAVPECEAEEAAQTPTTEAASPDAVTTPELEAEQSPNLEAELPTVGEAEAIAAELPLEEDLELQQYLPRLGSAVEVSEGPSSWIEEALSAEELQLQQYLPRLGSDVEVSEGPSSWIEEALSAEVADIKYDGAGNVLQAASAFMAAAVSILHRSPSYDPETKVAAFSRLSQEDSDSEEEFENVVGFAKLEQECACAAAHTVAEEKWRLVLSEPFHVFVPALAHMMPQGPKSFF